MIFSSAYSQNGYPKLIELPNGEVVVAITKQQRNALNLLKADYDQSIVIIADQEKLIEAYRQNQAVTDSIISNQDQKLSIQNERVAAANKVLEEIKKTLEGADKKIKWLKIQRGALGVLVVGLTALYLGK